MRNEYFIHGVQLGWLIDPEHQIMIEYKKTNARTRHGGVYATDDHSWRDLSGGETLPGFRVKSIQLDMVISQTAGSSSEDEVELICPYPNCQLRFASSAIFAAHSEWHRSELAELRYLQRQQH